MGLKKKSTTSRDGVPPGVRERRCHRERDGPHGPAAAVNGPVPRSNPGSPFPGCPTALRRAHIAAAAAALLARQPGAACAPVEPRTSKFGFPAGHGARSRPRGPGLRRGPGRQREGPGEARRGLPWPRAGPGGFAPPGGRTVGCFARAGDKSRGLRLTTSSGQRPALPLPAGPPPAAGPVGARFPGAASLPPGAAGKGRREGMCRRPRGRGGLNTARRHALPGASDRHRRRGPASKNNPL